MTTYELFLTIYHPFVSLRSAVDMTSDYMPADHEVEFERDIQLQRLV